MTSTTQLLETMTSLTKLAPPIKDVGIPKSNIGIQILTNVTKYGGTRFDFVKIISENAPSVLLLLLSFELPEHVLIKIKKNTKFQWTFFVEGNLRDLKCKKNVFRCAAL